jgi:hypothetical protein
VPEDHAVHRPGNGWPRIRRDNLAELGITEEEFEEYASKKPRRAADESVSELGINSLAMGMDVEPSAAPKQQAAKKPLTSECPPDCPCGD